MKDQICDVALAQASKAYLLPNHEYLWVDYCLTNFVAVLRIRPGPIDLQILLKTAENLTKEADDAGKFYVLVDEILLSSPVEDLY